LSQFGEFAGRAARHRDRHALRVRLVRDGTAEHQEGEECFQHGSDDFGKKMARARGWRGRKARLPGQGDQKV
jgi:hypothetical protein